MATELARNRFGVVLAHENPSYLELQWLPATADMADDDFMTGLMMLASEACAVGMKGVLVDTTQFGHSFVDHARTMAWRDERVIPRYNSAGVARFAFAMPAGYLGPTAETGGEPQQDGPADFPTQWFGERGNAVDWLAGA